MRDERKVKISPSLICTDMCNLERSVRELEDAGVDMLHIDIIDGYFSPSMPLGLDTVSALRKKTGLPFDVHLMVNDNGFFINEMLNTGVQQICFHYESAVHADRLLSTIKKSGACAGVALAPATPVSVLEYIIEKCDYIMLMLINPGFAGYSDENPVSYALRKIADTYQFINKRGLDVSVEIDGRVSIENIENYVSTGADILVAGSSSLFLKGNTLNQNLELIRQAAEKGFNRRKAENC